MALTISEKGGFHGGFRNLSEPKLRLPVPGGQKNDDESRLQIERDEEMNEPQILKCSNNLVL